MGFREGGHALCFGMRKWEGRSSTSQQILFQPEYKLTVLFPGDRSHKPNQEENEGRRFANYKEKNCGISGAMFLG